MTAAVFLISMIAIGCLNVAAEETNGFPDWSVVPGLVWGSASNGIRAGVTDRDPGVKGVLVLVAFSGSYGWHYVTHPEIRFSKVELRSPEGVEMPPVKNGKLFGDLPKMILLKDLPRFPERGTKDRGSTGGFRDWLIGNPSTLSEFDIPDSYIIEKEGDYRLTVWPVIYEYVPDRLFVSRLDLPYVATTVHLRP